MLNSNPGSALEWRVLTVDLSSSLIPGDLYHGDADFMGLNPTGRGATSSTLTLIRVEISGSGLIDLPRWEFTSIDKDPDTDTAVIVDNNLLAHPVLERWTTTDGLIFRDPYPDHRALSKRGLRVTIRNLACPYASGTDRGFAPIHMTNRSLPTEWLYERDLVEGSDYEVLYDKGAIKLNMELLRGEVFVAHTAVDLKASGHMEATNLMRKLLVQGAGIPEYQRGSTVPNIVLEPTGIILSKVTVDIAANGSILQAIRDILDQLPANYHLFADGNARIIGRFIQQEWITRIYNPVVQTPIAPEASVLADGKEAWYAVSAILADGKETLPSNLVSTVEYQNYFDAEHPQYYRRAIFPGAALTTRTKPSRVRGAPSL
ncbi:MAG: hypothetical protein MZW92_31440 [Comamonadaceae bacterium]|nr:hypothetical protein [Comamonadaceae bacterium]